MGASAYSGKAIWLAFVFLAILVTSVSARAEVTIRFGNATTQPVDYYLANPQTNAYEFYATIPPRATIDQISQEGIVWVFGVAGREIARYETQAGQAQTFTVSGDRSGTQPAPAAATSAARQGAVAGGASGPESLAGAAMADGTAWSYRRFVDADSPRNVVATLVLGVPETDDTRFVARCDAASKGVVSADLGFDVAGMTKGQGVRLLFRDQGFSQQAEAAVVMPDGEGVWGFRVRFQPDAPVWSAMQRGRMLGYGPIGRRGANLQLDGAAGPVAAFQAACRGFGGVGQNTAGQNAVGQNAAGKPTAAAATPSRAATTTACPDQRTARSTPGQSLTVRIANRTGEYRVLNWYDGTGRSETVTEIPDGEWVEVGTQTGHVWEATDGPGNCIEGFRFAAGQDDLTLTRKSPGFGAE